MSGNQPKHSRRWEVVPAAVWRDAGPIIAAGLSAHLVVVVLSKPDSQVPLLTALLATLVFAAVSFAYTFRKRATITSSTHPVMLRLQAGAFALVAIAVGAWLISRQLGTGANFYCTPLVPWRIEIALFGSFVVGCLTFLADGRRRGWAVYLLTMVAFLWIAPFYGFFSAPLFLGVSLNNMCPD